MVFFNVEKTFDSVWHEGLLHKLVIPNCYLYLTKIIASFLSGCVNKTYSASRPIPNGVPQGAILSPSLYNFFTFTDSPQSNKSETATFADDVSSGDPATTPRFSFHVLQTVENKNKRGQDPAHIRVGGHPIPWSTEVKYLGVILDKRLTFADQTFKTSA
jgi:hypothetical protein